MKTNLKKLLTAALAVAMLAGIMAIPASATQDAGFTDVKSSDWYYEAVTTMANAGVVNGVGDNKFDPNGKITWAQFATILWRLSLNDEWPLYEEMDAAHWGTQAMTYTYNVLKASPKPNAKSKTPTIEDMTVTRAAAANYLWQFFASQKEEYGRMIPWKLSDKAYAGTAQPEEVVTLEIVVNDLKPADIPDWNKVKQACGEFEIKGSWIEIYDECIMTAIRAGIINGVDDRHTFDPNGTLTRAQFCQMLYNAGVRGTMYDKYEIRGFGM